MERAALGLFAELRTPPTRSGTTHVGEGTGHRARTWNYSLNAQLSISNPVVLSWCATSRRTWRSARLVAPLVTTPLAAVPVWRCLLAGLNHCPPQALRRRRRRGGRDTRVRAKARPTRRSASRT